jgi:hypothetical protein
MDEYIDKNLKLFDSYSNVRGLSLQELEILIEEKSAL